MGYRDDLEALSARHDALAADVRSRQRELDVAALLLSAARARSKLPVLDGIRIAAPCSADWSQMSGDERVRACGACNKNVYNLTEMTRAEAEALIIAMEGKLCVRYYQRRDGTILLKDCVIGSSNRRRLRWIAVGVSAALAGGAAAARAPEASVLGTDEVEVVAARRPSIMRVPPVTHERRKKMMETIEEGFTGGAIAFNGEPGWPSTPALSEPRSSPSSPAARPPERGSNR